MITLLFGAKVPFPDSISGFVHTFVRPLKARSIVFAAAGAISAAPPVVLSNDRNLDPVAMKCLGPVQPESGAYTDTEPYAAVDPRDSRHVIAAWQTRGSTGSVMQWSASRDGGTTWTSPKAVPVNACAGGPVARAMRVSDSWVAFGSDGRAYMSAIAWTPNPSGQLALTSALVVVASNDAGSTWSPPVVASINRDSTTGYDNLAITADPLHAGTLYAVTTQDELPDTVHYYGRLGFTRSDDGGRTWTGLRLISPAVDGQRVSAPQIVADGKSGTLYAIYSRRKRGSASISVMTSRDRGNTWSEEVVAARYFNGGDVNDPVSGKPFILADDIVQAIVSPVDHRVIIAYTDAWRSPGKRYDVSIMWSADGKTWSAPIAVSDSAAGTAWLPAIAVASGGDPVVTFFSADFSPRTESTARLGVMMRELKRTEAGYALSSLSRIDNARMRWPGDYQALVASGGGFVGVYGREGEIVANRR